MSDMKFSFVLPNVTADQEKALNEQGLKTEQGIPWEPPKEEPDKYPNVDGLHTQGKFGSHVDMFEVGQKIPDQYMKVLPENNFDMVMSRPFRLLDHGDVGEARWSHRGDIKVFIDPAEVAGRKCGFHIINNKSLSASCAMLVVDQDTNEVMGRIGFMRGQPGQQTMRLRIPRNKPAWLVLSSNEDATGRGECAFQWKFSENDA
jgi:hypothetical protein